jgi:hypothetical protein
MTEPTNADALLWCPVCRDIVGHYEVVRHATRYKCLRCQTTHKVDAYCKTPKPKQPNWREMDLPGNPELARNRKKGRRGPTRSYGRQADRD